MNCFYCEIEISPKKSNPLIGYGFIDKETNQIVCKKCRKEHYRIKSNNGNRPFSIVEYPIIMKTTSVKISN